MDHNVTLTDKGEELLASLQEGRSSDELWNRLAIEAVRITERLDMLDHIIRNKGVLGILQAKREDLGLGNVAKVVVTVDHVLTEAREQAGQLRMIAQQLKLGQAEARPRGESELDKLRRRNTGTAL